MELDLEFQVSVKDMANQLYWQNDQDVIELIKAVDRRMADCSFTVELLEYFADALRGEGYTINLNVTEPGGENGDK